MSGSPPRIDLRNAPSAMEARAAAWARKEDAPALAGPARAIAVPQPASTTQRGPGRPRKAEADGRRYFPSGGPLKRHVSAKPSGRKNSLNADHPAVVEGRTKYPHSVVDAADSPRLLIEGKNQRKIGNTVVKGRWAGMPIYCLTLEERATCPRSCREWRTCYGNGMNWARRHRDDGQLMPRLHDEIAALSMKHPGGFVARLHILGDFFSLEYATFWDAMLDAYEPLRIFGFTAHPPSDEIGRYLVSMNAEGDRCWIRFSGALGAMGSLVIANEAASVHVLCPAQTGKTDCCGTCGLCWTMQRPIEFVRH